MSAELLVNRANAKAPSQLSNPGLVSTARPSNQRQTRNISVETNSYSILSESYCMHLASHDGSSKVSILWPIRWPLVYPVSSSSLRAWAPHNLGPIINGCSRVGKKHGPHGHAAVCYNPEHGVPVSSWRVSSFQLRPPTRTQSPWQGESCPARTASWRVRQINVVEWQQAGMIGKKR